MVLENIHRSDLLKELRDADTRLSKFKAAAKGGPDNSYAVDIWLCEKLIEIVTRAIIDNELDNF